jgi:alkylation response protein AidB-like acyl-CoA dehydrogenase
VSKGERVNAISPNPETTLLESAVALAPEIRALAEQIEQERALPEPLVDRLAEAGLFKMTVPGVLGGSEVDPTTVVRVIEELSRTDGSTGWCVTVANQLGLLGGYLPEGVAHEVFSRGLRAYVAGVVRSAGRALAVDGGYRVTGRWRFASGCRHATWLTGVADIYDGDSARCGADGQPERRWLLFPSSVCEIVDTWHVTGLRGTGSHDFRVDDVFVAGDHSLPLMCFFPSPRNPAPQPGPLYPFGIGVVDTSFAAVALGIARGAIDAIVGRGSLPAPAEVPGLLRDQPMIQAQVGHAEAQLRAARGGILDAVGEAWNEVQHTGEFTTERWTILKLMSMHATVVAAEVVTTLWYAAGASSIFVGNPLERRFRDVHVTAQRFRQETYAEAGRLLLEAKDRGT